MEEENFDWLDAYITASEAKDIKNSEAFKLLNSNNIDTHELTKHEKDIHAGEVQLNYKDEKAKEMDGRSFVEGSFALLRDMPEETLKALMMAFLNGTDVSANVVGVVFNAMTNSSPAMAEAFKEGDPAKFKKLVNGKIQEFSKYLDNEKKQVKAIGEGSGENSEIAKMVSWIVQDTPYAIPIRRKLKNMGVPDYINIPLAYGIGSGIAFDDDAQIFLNSEQVQNFKEMAGALPDSSEEKIFNTTYRTLEGTSLGFAFPAVFKALKYAKNNIPKYMDEIKKKDVKQISTAVGGAAIIGSVVEGNMNENNTEPSTDAEIDLMYGEGASEKAMIEATDLTDANIDKIYGEGASEKAMDEVLINNEKEDNWMILNSDKKTSYSQ
jgi:hypothetical protein